MDLETLLGALDSDELKEAVVELINDEKDRGKDAYRKKDKELSKWKDDYRDLGWDPDKFESRSDFIEKKKADNKKVTDLSLSNAELNDKINNLITERDQEREHSKQKAEEVRKAKLSNKLQQEIGSDFIGSQYLIKDLINSNSVDLNGEEVVFKDGDEFIPFSKGLEQLKETNKNMLKTNQKGGSGDVGGETPKQSEELSFVDKLKKEMKQ